MYGLKATNDKMMGDRSGLSGMGISLLLGMLTAVPVYALLPIAGLLLKREGAFPMY